MTTTNMLPSHSHAQPQQTKSPQPLCRGHTLHTLYTTPQPNNQSNHTSYTPPPTPPHPTAPHHPTPLPDPMTWTTTLQSHHTVLHHISHHTTVITRHVWVIMGYHCIYLYSVPPTHSTVTLPYLISSPGSLLWSRSTYYITCHTTPLLSQDTYGL